MHLFALDAAGKVIKEFQDADQMEFTEGDQYYFQCTAAGGNPAPSIDLTLGGQDVKYVKSYILIPFVKNSQGTNAVVTLKAVFSVVIDSRKMLYIL